MDGDSLDSHFPGGPVLLVGGNFLQCIQHIVPVYHPAHTSANRYYATTRAGPAGTRGYRRQGQHADHTLAENRVLAVQADVLGVCDEELRPIRVRPAVMATGPLVSYLSLGGLQWGGDPQDVPICHGNDAARIVLQSNRQDVSVNAHHQHAIKAKGALHTLSVGCSSLSNLPPQIHSPPLPVPADIPPWFTST